MIMKNIFKIFLACCSLVSVAHAQRLMGDHMSCGDTSYYYIKHCADEIITTASWSVIGGALTALEPNNTAITVIWANPPTGSRIVTLNSITPGGTSNPIPSGETITVLPCGTIMGTPCSAILVSNTTGGNLYINRNVTLVPNAIFANCNFFFDSNINMSITNNATFQNCNFYMGASSFIQTNAPLSQLNFVECNFESRTRQPWKGIQIYNQDLLIQNMCRIADAENAIHFIHSNGYLTAHFNSGVYAENTCAVKFDSLNSFEKGIEFYCNRFSHNNECFKDLGGTYFPLTIGRNVFDENSTINIKTPGDIRISNNYFKASTAPIIVNNEFSTKYLDIRDNKFDKSINAITTSGYYTTISSNTFNDASGKAIKVTGNNTGRSIKIEKNNISLDNNSGYACGIYTEGIFDNLDIYADTIFSTGTSHYGIHSKTNIPSGTMNIRNNNIKMGNSMAIYSENAIINGTQNISSNIIETTDQAKIYLLGSSGSGIVNVTSNTIFNTKGNGIYLKNFINTNLNLNVTNNKFPFVEQGSSGIYADNISGTSTLNINNNNFDYIDYGRGIFLTNFSTNPVVNINNNLFKIIACNNSGYENEGGICLNNFSNTRTVSILSNIFSDICQSGIFISNLLINNPLNINSNDFQENYFRGIKLYEISGSGNLTIKNNNIKGLGQIGLANVSGLGILDINSNTIFIEEPYGASGLYFTGIQNRKSYIQNNNITISRTIYSNLYVPNSIVAGINLESAIINSSDFKIDSNILTMTITTSLPYTTFKGIYMTGCSGNGSLSVTNNKITLDRGNGIELYNTSIPSTVIGNNRITSPNKNNNGISLYQSQSIIVRENSILGNNNGIYVEGNCLYTHFKCNKLYNNGTGFYFRNATISDQGSSTVPSGNAWFGDYITTNAKRKIVTSGNCNAATWYWSTCTEPSLVVYPNGGNWGLISSGTHDPSGNQYSSMLISLCLRMPGTAIDDFNCIPPPVFRFSITNLDNNNLQEKQFVSKSINDESTEGVSIETKSSLNLYPNPATDVINIQNEGNPARIIMYNVLGKVMFEGLLNKDENMIQTGNWSSGVYTYHFFDEQNNILKTGKLQIVR